MRTVVMNNIHSRRTPQNGAAIQKELRSLISGLRGREQDLLRFEKKAFNEHRALAEVLGMTFSFKAHASSSRKTNVSAIVRQELEEVIRELEEGNIQALVRRVNVECFQVTSHCLRVEDFIGGQMNILGSGLSEYLKTEILQVRNALDLLIGDVLLQLIRAYQIPVGQNSSTSISPQLSTLSGRANASVEAMEMFLEYKESLWTQLYSIQSKAFDAIEGSRQRSIDTALPLLTALATANAEVEKLQGRALPAQKPVLPSGVSEVGTDWFRRAHGCSGVNIRDHIIRWNKSNSQRQIRTSGSRDSKGVYHSYGGKYLFPLEALPGEVSADDFNNYLWDHRCPGRGKTKK